MQINLARNPEERHRLKAELASELQQGWKRQVCTQIHVASSEQLQYWTCVVVSAANI
jgi:hypothetical protein